MLIPTTKIYIKNVLSSCTMPAAGRKAGIFKNS